MAFGPSQCLWLRVHLATMPSQRKLRRLSCKEDLDGQDCADPMNYNDRILAPVMGNTVLSTCFGQCSTDGTCEAPPAMYAVTFQVDMSQYEGGFGTVNLNGSFAGWCGGCIAMADDNGDGIYAVTVDLPADTIEYKFTLDGWTNQENFAGGESCTSTIDGFTNRSYAVEGDATLPVVCWEIAMLARSTWKVALTLQHATTTRTRPFKRWFLAPMAP